MQANAHGLPVAVGGAAVTFMTYTQWAVSILAGIFTIGAAVYTMWPGIKAWWSKRHQK